MPRLRFWIEAATTSAAAQAVILQKAVSFKSWRKVLWQLD
jgi:hypothetical protein